MTTISNKQMRKLKRYMTVATMAVSLSGGFVMPIVASANSVAPTTVSALLASRALNNDHNGLGQIYYPNGSSIGVYAATGDDQANISNGVTTPNTVISYGNVSKSAVMFGNGQFVYCLQNHKGNPAGTPGTSWDSNLSDYANETMTVVMALGYPNTSLSSGNNSAIRDYMSTQYAIWAAEQDGQIKTDNGSMASLNSLSDGAGVIQRANDLYNRALDIMSKGGISYLTRDTHDEEKAKAESQLTADLTAAASAKTDELNKTVDSDLDNQTQTETKSMTKYMQDVSDKALNTVQSTYTKLGQDVLADKVNMLLGANHKPIATLNSSQYMFMDKSDNSRAFTFKPIATMPSLNLGNDDASTLIPNKTTKLDTKKNYAGEMNTSATGKVISSTAGAGLNELGDKVNTIAIKLDHQLPTGSYVMQGDQKINEQNNGTFIIKNDAEFEIHIPGNASSDTEKLSYTIVGNTALTLADFKASAKTDLSGTEEIKASAKDTVDSTISFPYHTDAEVGVVSVGKSPNPANQDTGVFVMNMNAVDKTDEVSGNVPVEVNKTKNVDADYSDKKDLNIQVDATAVRKADAQSKFSWGLN
ncbi:Cys-Gln thioester bond-forming surface protein [Weissella diestrammenae]|uniref:Cys-Gln thioester bond-forming surface protein n=1 Tax=Weissella diestrammenae TaxID=1162633 RepID=A0A7G9T3R5_9LACO|nr:thioester domain-containing protein [Weissella diestrammenae]QNN74740.1 Cys-Gln thioester bond-forming surface protein [Weissella diestrammenae]